MSAARGPVGIPGAGLASGASAVQFATSHGLQQRRILAKFARASQVAWALLAVVGTFVFFAWRDDLGSAGWLFLLGLYVLSIVGPTPLTLLTRDRVGLYTDASGLAIVGLVRRRRLERNGAEGHVEISTRAKSGAVVFALVAGGRATTIHGLLHLPASSIQAPQFEIDNHVLVRNATGGEWRETGQVVTDDNVDEIAAWLASPAAARS